MYLIGGGGGGGSGRAHTTAGITTTGGGGGGSSSITNGFFPANLLPDILYIQVGVGGAGGGGQTTSTNGSPGLSGTLSYVSIQPTTNSNSVLIASGNAAAGGGDGGLAASTPTVNGGTAGQAFSRTLGSSTGILNYLGIINSSNGETGAQSAFGTPTASNNVSLSFPISAGAGGAGTTTAQFAGGNILSLGIIPQISGGIGGGGNGNNGFSNLVPSLNSSIQFPFFFTGGAGGGSTINASSSTVGGDGGNGSYGSGGGGGGAVVKTASPRLSGAGGRGGDGLIIINCW